ncbi:MAG: YkgJ family cysteine cluster protein [Candidatus Eremiobacteraeota bacterium]|nr:YkgJ family cysteine cluster protein [Candidatus Eremiobacteraeota bacterium]
MRDYLERERSWCKKARWQMIVNESTFFDFNPKFLEITNPINDGMVRKTRILHKKNPAIRDTISKLIKTVVETYEKELFYDTCGRCGNCCRRSGVYVTARDIQQISLHLNLDTEDEARELYSSKTHTWNEKDGILKQEQGRCVFLEATPNGLHACRIFPVRPRACMNLIPAQEMCVKSPEKLLKGVKRITIKGDSVAITLDSGRKFEDHMINPSLLSSFEKLKSSLLEFEEETLSEFSHLVRETARILDEEHEDLIYCGLTPRRIERIIELQEMVANLEMIEEAGEPGTPLVGELKDKMKAIGSLLQNNLTYRTGKAQGSSEACGTWIKALRFLPEVMFVIGRRKEECFQGTLLYRDNQNMLSLSRELINAALAIDHELLRAHLRHKAPGCFMCGACCREYQLEITREDVENLAAHLKMTVSELENKYLGPGRFTWNSSDRIITKVKRGADTWECPFLRQIAPDKFCCTIYEGRPQMCRDYRSTNRLCRKTSLSWMPHTHVHNILYIDCYDCTLHIKTIHDEDETSIPLLIDLTDEKEISGILSRIKDELCRHFDLIGVISCPPAHESPHLETGPPGRK